MADTIQRSFTAGEISPSLHARADLSKYTNGLALCENFIVRSQGGVWSRPGTRFIGEVDDSTRRTRLIPFQFNTEQTYVLVFEHLKIFVIKDGAFVMDGVNRYEIASPYTEDQLPRLSVTQSADVMTIVHPAHDPRNLSRLDHDNWSLDVISYAPTIDPPTFTERNVGTFAMDSDTTVPSSSGVSLTNPAVVTLDPTPGPNQISEGQTVKINNCFIAELMGRVFTAVNVTAYTFELLNTDTSDLSYNPATPVVETITALPNISVIGNGAGSYVKDYEYAITAVDDDGVESLISNPLFIRTESLSTTAGVRLSWDASVNADYYRIYKLNSVNTNIYGWIGDSRTTSFDDYNFAPITSDAPPRDRQPFTEVNDKPACVNYYQQRQIFANTINEPQTVFTTQTGNFQSFRTSSPTRDSDAVTFGIASRQVNEIRHIVSVDALVLLTSGGEWLVTEGQDQILTPSTIGVKIQSYNGASWAAPAIVDDTVIYVQDQGTRLRDLKYSFNDDKYSGNDLSIMAEHLFEGHEITEIAYAAEPYDIVWCIRDDGKLLGLTYQREHQVWAWHQHNTDGQFESLTVISEDGRDAVYAVVKRTINGSDVRYVERIEPRFDDSPENAFCVDSGLSYNGAPASTFTQLDHLEGKEVIILADGNVVKNQVVTSGSVTIPRPASVVHIGLPYTPVIETLELDAASMSESLKVKKMSINKVTLQVLKSRGGWVGGIDEQTGQADMQEIKPRYESDGYGPLQLKSFKQAVSIQPGWVTGGKLRIEQRDPLPLAITAIIPELDISG